MKKIYAAYEARGLNSALEALVDVKKQRKAVNFFMCRCIRKALPVYADCCPGDPRPLRYVEAREYLLQGLSTDEEECDAWQEARQAEEEAERAVREAWSARNAAEAAFAASTKGRGGEEAAVVAIQAVFLVNARSAALFTARAVAIIEYRLVKSVQFAAWAIAFAAGRDAVRSAAKGPPREALRAVQSAARGKIWKSARDEAYKAVRGEFAAELLRLCRLEGEYGELGGDALWDCP